MKDWVSKSEVHSDKDCWMEFNWVGDTMFSISKSRHNDKYFVQIAGEGLFFNTDSVRMAYDIVKSILIKEK